MPPFLAIMKWKIQTSTLAACLLVLASACGPGGSEPRTPTAPAVVQAPAAAQSSVTLSGTALEYTPEGSRPLPGVPLLVRAGYGFLQVTTDATGRYSLPDVPSGAVSIAPAAGSGYYAPCPAGSDVVHRDATFDVHIESAMLLSTTGAMESVPRLGSIWVSGMVFEKTPQGARPIGGASVNLGGDDADLRLGSTTLTDAAGRYLVCPPLPGTGTDSFGAVRVRREGYRPASRSAFLGWDYTGIDIELVRN